MKRDPDLLREMLFEFEQQEDWLIAIYPSGEMSEKTGHVKLLCDAGFVAEIKRGTYRHTNDGYDYLDAIRSDTIWAKTKSGAAKVGGMTLGMMRDLALTYVKQEAAEKLGIQL